MESKIINNVILVYLDRHTVDVVSLILLKHSILSSRLLPLSGLIALALAGITHLMKITDFVSIFFIKYSNLNKLAMC